MLPSHADFSLQQGNPEFELAFHDHEVPVHLCRKVARADHTHLLSVLQRVLPQHMNGKHAEDGDEQKNCKSEENFEGTVLHGNLAEQNRVIGTVD